MPIHDWSTIPSGLFHHFHQTWSVRLADALNEGHLPQGISAMVEQRAGRKIPDVLAIEMGVDEFPAVDEIGQGGMAVAEKPTATITERFEREIYGEIGNSIVLRHHLGRIVAVIEILSPGNKESRSAINELVQKTCDLMRAEVHVMIVDLFPPSQRDPQGIHKLIWDDFQQKDFEFPSGKDRMVMSYEGGPEVAAYLEPLAVGDPLPEMPLMLPRELHIKVPLESTYMRSWELLPQPIKNAVLNKK